MCRRYDRNRLARDVHAIGQAALIYSRKPLTDEVRLERGEIEVDTRIPRLRQMSLDRPGHDITRRERGERVNAVHEMLPA